MRGGVFVEDLHIVSYVIRKTRRSASTTHGSIRGITYRHIVPMYCECFWQRLRAASRSIGTKQTQLRSGGVVS